MQLLPWRHPRSRGEGVATGTAPPTGRPAAATHTCVVVGETTPGETRAADYAANASRDAKRSARRSST